MRIAVRQGGQQCLTAATSATRQRVPVSRWMNFGNGMSLMARRCAAVCFRMAGCADRSQGLRGYRRVRGFTCIVPGDAAHIARNWASSEAMHAIARADLCLIPVRPSPADTEAAIPTLIAVRGLNRRFAFVLNQTPPRGCRLSEAATSLNSLGVLALPYVGQRNDHQDALGAGLGVTEFAQEGRASDEVELWRWVLKKLVEGSLDP
jgi:hypothetical protein